MNDGTANYHAKRNKPVGERQIPYDLTYKRNVMNKIKSAQQNQRCRITEQTDSSKRGEKTGKRLVKKHW